MMGSRTQNLVYFLLVISISIAVVDGNSEGDALFAWKTELIDPYNVLQSWDPTLVNPCTWFHVACNSDDSVTRVDLGNAGLSGPLVPELAKLINLQYLNVYGNKISGVIPSAIGELGNLISLVLHQNQLTGAIPPSLGNLTSLKFLEINDNMLSGSIPESLANLASLRTLRLDNNNLTGILPIGILQLVSWGNLRLLNVSQNILSGTVPAANSTEFAVTTIIQDPQAQK